MAKTIAKDKISANSFFIFIPPELFYLNTRITSGYNAHVNLCLIGIRSVIHIPKDLIQASEMVLKQERSC